ncbi:cysteine desulfurase family protein [Chlamydiifrater phoenicopteri]|uniref:cysteine desulfurase family protein n=1 Tax=Chlamydiifrater phoenicopteri TaxID=2681469 RepID=UPI001BCFA47F|nr:cysteine desulfurase family protein [Chlamydiifrater phoenicopteri]
MVIYLDNSSTTPPDPRLLPYLEELFFQKDFLSNPSAMHSSGRKAASLLRKAEDSIQKLLGFSSKIIFTSGATESLNLIINSLPPGHIITSSLEHPAVIEPLKRLPSRQVSYLDPDGGQCVLSLSKIEDAIRSDTIAIVLGWVNAETGAKTDIASIAKLAFDKGLIFIVDATAIIGKERISVPNGVSALCFSGHKIHALAGTGVLAVSPKMKLIPQILGGGQQGNIRSGTENVLGIAALDFVVRYLINHIDEVSLFLREMRDAFEDRLLEKIPELTIHCAGGPRVSNIATVAFPSIEGEILRAALDLEGVESSYGTACSSGAVTAFKSLTAMGITQEVASSSLRFSFGRLNTMEEVERAVGIIVSIVGRMQEHFL